MNRDAAVPDFSALLDNTPASKQWPLLRELLDKHPLELGSYLRNHRPIAITDDCVLLSRYDDVIEALDQPTIFSVQLYKPKMGSYLMTEDDTARHNEDKAIMTELLSHENLSQVRKFIAGAANSLLQKQQSMNLVSEYSKLVPALMVQNVFGLDGIAPQRLIGFSYWNQYSAFRNQPFHPAGVQSIVERKKFWSNLHMGLYLAILLIRKQWKLKRGRPDNDTVTRLIQRQFPRHGSPRFFRKAINTGGLLIGAIETTSEAVVHTLTELHKRPEMFEKARQLAQQADSVAFDKMCWEALRHKPIAPYIIRKLATDYTFSSAAANGDDVTLKKGNVVLCLISSAMFDDSGFSHPAVFDPERQFGNSFHLGYGHHACLGHAFGKLLVPEMVRQLLRKPGFCVTGDMEYKGDVFPAYLPVALDDAAAAPVRKEQKRNSSVA